MPKCKLQIMEQINEKDKIIKWRKARNTIVVTTTTR